MKIIKILCVKYFGTIPTLLCTEFPEGVLRKTSQGIGNGFF